MYSSLRQSREMFKAIRTLANMLIKSSTVENDPKKVTNILLDL